MLMRYWALLFHCFIFHNFVRAESSSSWQTWGPYRPNLYFGVRPQIPESLLMGLMWANGTDKAGLLNSIRDTCEQDEGMRYGWSIYDTRTGGSQALYDEALHLDLSVDFIKTQDGKTWAVKVTGSPRSDAPSDLKTAIIIHVAVEQSTNHPPNILTCGMAGQAEAMCSGDVTGLGQFSLRTVQDVRNKVLGSAVVKSVQVPEAEIWQAKSVFKNHVYDVKNLESDGVGNMHFIQTTFEGAFTITLTYHDSESDPISSDDFQRTMNDLQSSFSTDIQRVFPRSAPFDYEKFTPFTHYLLSNLLGGMGFFHGDSRADLTHAPEYEETEPMFWEAAKQAMARADISTTNATSLVSFVPSRPFFPRGFLWDEGFHLLLVIEWDLDLAVSVLQSWLSLMDDDGWIGREQILGPEARSKVPREFQTQYPHYANPPTLLLLFNVLVSKLANRSKYTGHRSKYMASSQEASALLKKLYPLLSRHYEWFRRTQSGDFGGDYPRPDDTIEGEGYRWRGRTPEHTLTSGLDDYPRANPPHPSELHVDALTWVGASARALHQVAELLGQESDASMYQQHLTNIEHNLDILYWNDAEKVYCDSTTTVGTRNSPKYEHVCHLGYVSLFPLLLGFMDAKHKHLPDILDLLSDTSKLWSPYGLRSLSKTDPNYGKNENYWRGPIWVNINVLAILSLHKIGHEDLKDGETPSEIQMRALSLGSNLRKALVTTVYDGWEATGFAWEQYSDESGEGSRSRAFTGWTADVILVMGLDFGEHISKSTHLKPFHSTAVFGAAVLAVLILAFIIVFRRCLTIAAMRVMQWRNLRHPPGYQQIPVDLDEFGSVSRA
ncbi:unnamed protein product [Clonostachys rosea]|uniref:Mannosyl-oligosaccharide glucosidase n=1 Tax=Bionectria ochroleuca TaxID=29856 RepID=A0ABY6TZF3_BIOOC|nr:unnamed protein product [Clonostachys rosea]